ncbi:MAG: hypothetical protein NXI30_20545 [bacterium]|nr:hypothetical protein [bacterium]
MRVAALSFAFALALSSCATQTADLHGRAQRALAAGDTEEAEAFLERAAERGDPLAQLDLGLVYARGSDDAHERARAVELFQSVASNETASRTLRNAAEAELAAILLDPSLGHYAPDEARRMLEGGVARGSAPARHALAKIYELGRGVPVDARKAARLYERNVEEGFAPSISALGVLHANGTGVLLDDPKAVRLYRRAAELGDREGQFNLGWRYQLGKGAVRSRRRAIELYELAAAQGHPGARVRAGEVLWLLDRGAETDARALRWLELAGASSDPANFLWIGQLFEGGADGRGRVDIARAEAWYRKGVAADDPASMMALAALLLEKREPATEAADREALDLHERLAASGLPAALEALALHYQLGRGVERSAEKAASLRQRAAELGDGKALYVLAEEAIDANDLAKARVYYQDAARQGFIPALDRLLAHEFAGVFEEHSGPWIDERLREGANSGNVVLSRWLAYRLERVATTEADWTEVVRLLRFAASGGDALAVDALVSLEARGLAPRIDKAELRRWARVAAESGHPEGMDTLAAVLMREARPSSRQEGCMWAERALAAGSRRGKLLVGLCLVRNGIADPRTADFERAHRLLGEVAATGEAQANEVLGDLYVTGRGVPVDFARAVTYYRVAAEAGLPLSQNNVGYGMLRGDTGQVDVSGALPWLEKAAAQDFAFSHGLLARIYADGLGGTPRDPAKARRHDEAARRGGYVESAEVRRVLEALERDR